MNDEQASKLLETRKADLILDTKEMQIKRNNFLNWLSVNSIGSDLCTFEMHDLSGDIFKTPSEKFNYFNPMHNTRTKIYSETCLEIDKLPFDKAIALMGEIILSLIRGKIHFAVFYAPGQRSPHLRIYDFFEMDYFSPIQRLKAQIQFWRQHVPFGCFHYVDTGIFIDEHPLQLEYSVHYRHNTIFDLFLEYIPKPELLKIPERRMEEPIIKTYNDVLLCLCS